MTDLLNAAEALVSRYETLLWALVTASVLMLIVSLIAVPWVVLRLPADYYSRHLPRPRLSTLPAALRLPLLLLKNAVGGVLLLAGIAMLFLPGQGVLTLLLALALLDFPGKLRAERWLVSRPAVFAALNWLRRRGGRPPLTPASHPERPS